MEHPTRREDISITIGEEKYSEGLQDISQQDTNPGSLLECSLQEELSSTT